MQARQMLAVAACHETVWTIPAPCCCCCWALLGQIPFDGQYAATCSTPEVFKYRTSTLVIAPRMSKVNCGATLCASGPHVCSFHRCFCCVRSKIRFLLRPLETPPVLWALLPLSSLHATQFQFHRCHPWHHGHQNGHHTSYKMPQIRTLGTLQPSTQPALTPCATAS